MLAVTYLLLAKTEQTQGNQGKCASIPREVNSRLTGWAIKYFAH